jgi:hypothetical protein
MGRIPSLESESSFRIDGTIHPIDKITPFHSLKANEFLGDSSIVFFNLNLDMSKCRDIFLERGLKDDIKNINT